MLNKTAKLTIILSLPVLGCFFLIAENLAAQSPPETVTIDQLSHLYEPVIFDHLTHSENYNCSRCHHDSSNDAENGTCSTCHSGRPINGKSSCSSCHNVNILKKTEDSRVQNLPKYHIDTPGLKATWHFLCRNCHLEEDGPTECQDCHAFTVTGRAFFKVK